MKPETSRRMRRLYPLILALAPLAVASPAVAAPDATEQARAFFDVGSQAYDAGNYEAAIKAFQEAYKIAPRPGLVFSMAQAHRRQYSIDSKPEHLLGAVKYYREYVARVEQGGRRGEAVEALAQLQPLADKLDKSAEPAKPTAEIKPQTSLMIMTKTKGAMIRVDGAAPVAMPFIAEVKPGKHTLKLTAEGYFPEDREVEAVAGLNVPLDVPLREMPGKLTLLAKDGAQVMVDGRLTATTPLQRPIEIPPGRHVIAVSRTGYKGFTREIDLDRGESKTLDARLEITGQRIVAYGFMGVGVAGLLTGGTLAALAVVQQNKAKDIDARATTTGCPPADTGCTYKAYAGATDARDNLRRFAGVALGAGAAVGVTGLMLFVFDQPVLGAPPEQSKSKSLPKDAPKDTQMEVSAAPAIGPGFYGASVVGRF